MRRSVENGRGPESLISGGHPDCLRQWPLSPASTLGEHACCCDWRVLSSCPRRETDHLYVAMNTRLRGSSLQRDRKHYRGLVSDREWASPQTSHGDGPVTHAWEISQPARFSGDSASHIPVTGAQMQIGCSSPPGHQGTLPRPDLPRGWRTDAGQGLPQGPTTPALPPACPFLSCAIPLTQGVLRGNSLPREGPGNKPDPKCTLGLGNIYKHIGCVYVI